MIDRKKIDEIIKIIATNYQPEKIILFGSYAQGEPDEDSDLDLLIIKNSNLPRYKRTKEIRKYLRGQKLAIDLIVYTWEEIEKWRHVRTSFISKILNHGKLLYEQ